MLGRSCVLVLVRTRRINGASRILNASSPGTVGTFSSDILVFVGNVMYVIRICIGTYP